MRKFLVFLGCVLIFTIAGNLILPQFFAHPLYDRDPSIDLTFKTQIDADEPELIVMGNSLIERGVDFELLQELTGQQIMRVSSGGSGSALWYLLLKNEIAAAEHPPRYVIIVFKDNVFSVPNLSVEGKYQTIIDQYAAADEPVLDQLAYLNYRSPFQRFLEANDAWIRYNPAFREWLVDGLRTSVVASIFGVDSLQVDEAVDDTFDPEKLDPELVSQTSQPVDAVSAQLAGNYDFDEFLDASFLAPMLQVAQENSIQLIFVAYRARHYVEYPGLDQRTETYFADLNAYLEGAGAILIDFRHDERIQIEHFAEGDHLNGEGNLLFTEMLAEKLNEILASR